MDLFQSETKIPSCICMFVYLCVCISFLISGKPLTFVSGTEFPRASDTKLPSPNMSLSYIIIIIVAIGIVSPSLYLFVKKSNEQSSPNMSLLYNTIVIIIIISFNQNVKRYLLQNHEQCWKSLTLIARHSHTGEKTLLLEMFQFNKSYPAQK